MVAFSPRFAFLATLCTLAALSSAPISDAAVLRLRTSDLASTEMTSTHTDSEAATWMPRRSSHVVDDAPVLPLPQGLGGSQKKSADTSDRPSGPSSGGDTHGEKDVFEGHDAEDSTYDDNGSVSKKSGKAKARERSWNSFRPITRLSESWFGGNRVHYARAPHHHHHHHHHDRSHRGAKARRSEFARDRDLSSSATSAGGGHVHAGRSPHHHHHHSGYKKVVVSGDHDHVRFDRSPHHHHYHNGHGKVVVSGDHDHVRVDRRSHYHHHHHHHHHLSEHETVVVSGDHDHVRVDRSLGRQRANEDRKTVNSGETDHVHHQRSVLIAGEQGRSYVVQRVTKRSSSQELFTVPPLGKRAGGLGCAPGYIQIMSPGESGGKFLASLILASTNSTSSENSTTPSPAFVLNASEDDVTPMCLQASSYTTSDPTLNSDEIGVTLLVEMFDAASASIVPYCATFDPDPPRPAPLTAEECTDDPVSERQSQLFAFNRATGVVRPMWFKTQGDRTDLENNGCAGGDDREGTKNSLQQSVADSEVTGDSGASTPNADQADQSLASNLAVLAAGSSEMAPSDSFSGNTSDAQNVNLVFVAMDPVVTGTPDDAGAAISSVPATVTGAEGSTNAFTATVTSTPMMTTASSTARVSVSSQGSVSASSISSAVPSASSSAVASSGSPTPMPSSTELVSGAHSASSMVLGVQVVPEPAGNTASVTSASATPTMTPVNTQPYEWMFKLD